MLHSAVAILKLAEMPYSPANTLFMRTLMLKKYALPYRVVDALVEYFCSYEEVDEPPPVLWQQTLLAFAQHYKSEITSEQKEALKALMRAQPHADHAGDSARAVLCTLTRGPVHGRRCGGHGDGDDGLRPDVHHALTSCGTYGKTGRDGTRTRGLALETRARHSCSRHADSNALNGNSW